MPCRTIWYTVQSRNMPWRHEGGQTVLRIVADAPPGPEARACTPVLEDLYLYHFSGETEAQ